MKHFDPNQQLGAEPCNCNQGRLPCTCGQYQRIESYAGPVYAVMAVAGLLALGLLIWSV